jgi:hypothetical protein
VERTIRALADITGESITDAIGAAERLERLRSSLPSCPKLSVKEIMDMVRSYNLQPINEGLTEDEILGYGPNGYCE